MILPALVSHLLADANVSALVADRIYPDEIPPGTSETPNTMPLLTYSLLDNPAEITHDKKSTYQARVQIDAWGGSYKSAHDVTGVVKNSLHGYKGAMGSSGVHVGLCLRETARDNNFSENVGLYHVEQVFIIRYKE